MSSRVAILEAKRTPIGKFLGAFKDIPAVTLGADVARQVLFSSGISPSDVDEVLIGHARQAGCGPNPARQVSVGAGIPETVPAFTINAACGSGIKSIALAADAIRLGRATTVLAGGMESMSRVPFMLDRAREGYRLGNGAVVDGMYRDGFLCPLADMLMGATAEILAEEFDISREEQDDWAAMSQHRVERAMSAQVFADEIAPVTVARRGESIVVDSDEHPRAGVTVADLARLPAVFRKDGSVTAGNASGITDGAAALVLASEQAARASGKRPLGWIRDFVATGVEPRRMGIGPVPAVRQILERNDLKLDDVGVIELNEAFAAQVIACERELKFDRARVNPNGGAISLGHPIGCTGARIVVTLLHEMRRRSASLGIATLCVSGGMGMALLVERD
ncbi:MAG: thiolase family protein [Candidatus Krumholzibacteria bacterium]|nr:thiolase family protein [Candidatus Krumholzibacteria bacterium]MDH4336177.1 thiolase family protein [Candidatus Krumholzibacteria bacterium]MDH5268818.1 thiolase family protein [Candidatus Krumholzibacteria bacterium]